MEEELDPETDIREQQFHSTVREYVIFLLLFLFMYGISFYIICKFRRRDSEEYLVIDKVEVTVYRFSLWLCTFSLSVCLFATLLLPFSIISNEVLLLYPTSYYIKWLNHSLVQGLWNLVFLFSNISLFILLPFAYLFTESEGFSGFQRGVQSRVYESLIILSLLIVIVLGFTYVISSLIDKENADLQTFLNLKSYYLPFLYSCISFLGVIMLLLCTPLGFARLFTVVSGCLVKPQFLHDLSQDFRIAKLEENCYRRRLEQATLSGKSYLTPPPMCTPGDSAILQLNNGALQQGLSDYLTELTLHSNVLDKRRKTWMIQRNLVYPMAILILVVLTVITVLLVLQNTIELLIGIKALPVGTMQFTLGLSSLSKLGTFGALLEVVIILFLAVTSTVGLYSLPLFGRISPELRSTSFPVIIANCAILLILSSALPLLSRTIGITNFDLLGEYGQIEWLGNFKIILSYNVIFALVTTLCIVNKCSSTVRREIYNRFYSIFQSWIRWDDLEQASKTSLFSKQD